MEIDIDRHIAKQKNEELRYKARYKKLMEVMTKHCAREWPPGRSPCETIPEMDDEALGSNHRIQEWVLTLLAQSNSKLNGEELSLAKTT